MSKNIAINIALVSFIYVVVMMFGWQAGPANALTVFIFMGTKLSNNYKSLSYMNRNRIIKLEVSEAAKKVIWYAGICIGISTVTLAIMVASLMVGTIMSYGLTGTANEPFLHMLGLCFSMYLVHLVFGKKNNTRQVIG